MNPPAAQAAFQPNGVGIRMLEAQVKCSTLMRLTIVGQAGVDPSHTIVLNPEYIVCLEPWFSSVPSTQVGYGNKPKLVASGCLVTLVTGRVLRTGESMDEIEADLEEIRNG